MSTSKSKLKAIHRFLYCKIAMNPDAIMAANRVYFFWGHVVVGSNPTRTETFCGSVVRAHVINSIISPDYVPTAIAAYCFKGMIAARFVGFL